MSPSPVAGVAGQTPGAFGVQVAAKALSQIEQDGRATVALMQSAALPAPTATRGSLVNVRA